MEGLPVSPTLNPSLQRTKITPHLSHLKPRILLICLYAIVIGALAALAAYGLTLLISLITNLSFYGHFSTRPVSPAGHPLGFFVIFVPVIGALIIGLMARYGSTGIRGHGIPEAMERVLLHESKIPIRLTFLKPLSAAISIGTGGPFGAEGPIIATGGALGSLWGQLAKITDHERRTLLAAGAAAGLAATFASPVASVLLAIELLLFEYRARSIIPVALAAITAQAVRLLYFGTGPVFPMENVIAPDGTSFLIYGVIGIIIGFVSVGLTRLVHSVENLFEKIPIHWMWHPAIGALAVGLVGYFDPRVFGVGYHYIEQTLNGELLGKALLVLGLVKFITWTIYVGSGTSGGTLAPMFIMGGALGTALGLLAEKFFPGIGIDHRIAALVGMAGIFTGASRAFLASVVLALETTHQPLAFIPVFTGCAASYLVSCLTMSTSIMTESMTRRGIRVPEGFGTESMAHVRVKDYATYPAIVLRQDQTIEETRPWLNSNKPETQHHFYPLVDHQNRIVGSISRAELWRKDISLDLPLKALSHSAPICIRESDTLQAAMDLMAKNKISQLSVVEKKNSSVVLGLITWNDIFKAYSAQSYKDHRIKRTLRNRTHKK